MNPFSRLIVVGLAALAAAAGCGGRAPLKLGDAGSSGGQGGDGDGGGEAGGHGDAGGGGNSPTCQGLDEKTCGVTSGCAARSCPTCYGQTAFTACYRADETPPVCYAVPCAPPPPMQPPCSSLDETSCRARSDCHPGSCGNCSGALIFSTCLASNEAVACPTFACIPRPCASETTLAGCDARVDCHSVLAEQGTCDCPIVPALDHCADGDKTACRGTTTCHRTPPYCEPPDYVVSYAAGCYEGCVRARDCAP